MVSVILCDIQAAKCAFFSGLKKNDQLEQKSCGAHWLPPALAGFRG